MKFGIVTRSFFDKTIPETAKFMAAHGYTCTELCMGHPDFGTWTYNKVPALDDAGVSAASLAEKAAIFRDHGIEVTALGVFTNMLAPEDDFRGKCIDEFIRCMDFAAGAGIKNLSTELGFRQDRRGITTDVYESDFARLVESFTRLGSAAKDRGVNICVEACAIDVVPSAKRLRDFIAQIYRESGLTTIKVLLDMANFIANSDEDDVFKYLAPHIAYFHGKDRRVNDCYGKIIGEGDIDWVKFFMNFYKLTPELPFILEYTKEETVNLSNERVANYTKQAKANLALQGYNVQGL